MKILMVIFCLLPALCCSGEITVTGCEGQSVTVRCSHSWASENKKYFCKNQCSSDDDVLIKSEGSQSNKKNGRFSLFDEGTGTFRVTITGLKKTDTGKYRCVVNRLIKDTYTEVYLSVLDAPCSTAVPPETTTSSQVGGQTTDPCSTAVPSETTTSSQVGGQTAVLDKNKSSVKTTLARRWPAAGKTADQSLYLTGGLVVMVMVLVLALGIFARMRLSSRKSQGSGPTFSRHSADTAQPGEISCTEYSNTEMKNLNKQPEGAPAIHENPPDTLVYCSINFLQSQECPIYCNVTHPRKVSEMPPDATRNSNSVLYSSVNLPQE